ncbi:MAG: Xaa-Pro peptidase family protein [Dehalococcoidia bacterium]|nr:Xaa-Pro peptidase family protein [Dehalococcoidia bacterium]
MSIAPILTEQERDRRYSAIRKYMRERDLGAILIGGEGSNDHNIRYFTGQYYRIVWGSALLLLTPNGEPVLFMGSKVRKYLLNNYRMVAPKDYWVQEVKPFTSDTIAGALKERDFTGTRVGVPMTSITAASYQELVAALPGKEIVDVSKDLLLMRRVRSDEELKCLRGACELADAAWKRLLATAKVGMTTHQILAACEHEMFYGGADRAFNLLTVGQDVTRPIFTSIHRPVTAKAGDWLLAELTTSYGGYWNQNVYLGCLGEPPAQFREMYKVSRAVTHTIERMLKPGVLCSDIAQTMDQEVEKAGYLGNGAIGGVPHGHILGLDIDELSIAPDLDTPIEEGWTFVIHPNVAVKGWEVGKPGIFGPATTFAITKNGSRRLLQEEPELGIIPV